MKNNHYTVKEQVISIIEGRLAMQSTQRTLANYGVRIPSLSYILSEEFYSKYSNFSEIKKREFLEILAGRFHWTKAKQLIEK